MATISSSLSLRAQRLRDTPWPDVIRSAWLVFLGAIFIRLILPSGLGHSLRPLLLGAPLLVLAAKDLSHLPDALAHTRAALRKRAWRTLPAAWLPPGLVGLLRLDSALRRGFMGWLLRRPRLDAQPAGQAFGYLKFGAYRTGCAFVLFSSLVELPLDAAIVPLLVADEGARMTIHLLMLAGALSSIVYMLGDRWLIGAGCHVLADDGLQLRIGARTHGTIPLHAIAACERIDEPVEGWLRRHGIARRYAVRVSPLDKPNTVLIFTPGSRVRLTHLGVERTALACVFLYLDRPQALRQALAPS